MKKLILAAMAALFIMLVPMQLAAAAGVCSESGTDTSAYCQGRTKTDPIAGPNGVLVKVANILAILAGIAAVIMLMIAGIRYVTSSGDPGNIKKAKDTVIHTIIGLVVIVAAWTLIVFVVSRIK